MSESKFEVKCNICGKQMRLEDRDFKFKGNYDEHFVCDNCKNIAMKEVKK